MLIFKMLHILSMFAAVTFLVGEALLYGRAIWRGDIAALAAVRRLLGARPVAGVVFLLSGIVFGALAALTGQIDLLEGWLVAAYAMVVALFLVNASPWVQRLPRLGAEAIEAVAGQGQPSRSSGQWRKSAPRLSLPSRSMSPCSWRSSWTWF